MARVALLRYAITDRHLLATTAAEQSSRLIRQAAALAKAGVEYLQIREKDLDAAELVDMCVRVRDAVRATSGQMTLIVNGPPAMAMACGFDGAHITLDRPELAKDLLPQRAGGPLVLSLPCRSAEEAAFLTPHTDLLLFAPVFEKRVRGHLVQSGTGLEELSRVCTAAGAVPVFALGGVTWVNAQPCAAAGATGVAGIRLFLPEEDGVIG